MRILVTGRNGQLGRALGEVIGTEDGVPGADVVFVDRETFDLAEPASIASEIARLGPDVVINAAAYTAVDQAEDEPARAFEVNEAGPAAIAEALAPRGGRLIHVSTDYVFDGAKDAPYLETDATNPQSVYGCSKAAGEVAVRRALDDHVIVRTAWVYSPFGKNFVKTMLRLASERDALTVVADQWGSPTSAHELARAIAAVCRSWQGGSRQGLGATYHFAGGGEANWAGVARAIFEASRAIGGPAAEVADIATADWPAKAARPLNSRLNSDLFAAMFGYRAPDWRTSLQTTTVRIVRES